MPQTLVPKRRFLIVMRHFDWLVIKRRGGNDKSHVVERASRRKVCHCSSYQGVHINLLENQTFENQKFQIL